jgi:tRNA (guanine-N7-)-methyltransferase
MMAGSLGKKQTLWKAFRKKLDNNPKKRFYGRRQNRPLNTSRAEAIDALLPVLSLDDGLLTEKGDLAPSSLFDSSYKECWFEIGFGSGEHLAELMRRHPENAYIGAEPFINGMAAFLKQIKDEPHNHVRVHMDDALMVANSLADSCLDGIYILNPDPWHKTRHHKRRIVRPETLDIYARILKPGGALIMSTDVLDLADWMLTHAFNHPAFEWSAKNAHDWREPPKDWITTVYEVKGAKGAKKMSYLFFNKKLETQG